MSNIIKAGEYIYGSPEKKPVVLSPNIHLIDTGHTSEQMIKKIHEALDEMLNEFCNGPVHTTRAMGAMMDVNQIMSGYLLAINREELPNINPVERVKNQFDIASAVHLQKMKFQAAEQHWEMIYE